MKKFVIASLLVLVATVVYSQNDLLKEIMSYSDSTEMMIRNGKKLILEKTVSGDHQSANSTLNYIKSNADKSYVVLFPVEELLFSLATRNFQLFLYNAKNFETLLEDKTKTVAGVNITPGLNEYLTNEIPFISEDLDNTQLAEYDKEVISMYIRYYTGEDPTGLRQSVKKYQKTYPDSEYSYFINGIKRTTNNGRMNFTFGYGNEFLSGDISETFTNRLHVLSMEMDGFINQLYLSLFLDGSVNRVFSNIDLPIKDTDLTHTKDQKVSSLKYGIKIGRTVFSNKRLVVYPFLTIGGYQMNSQSDIIDKNDSNNTKNNLTSSFLAGVGAASDIMLIEWKSKSAYEPDGFLFIRPQIGYDQFLSGKKHTRGSDFYFMISLGVSLGSL
ncbi:hypothetical protein SAMN05444274_10888 [Mariniphaga anaerophila]|uniref:Uncharacterized protein n=1 Tax=Mariniphaga anaerophila TaxID=1484053 RepID=A0A1M5E526_9BACT|nr:hypothetical protein [Mariniphaga anaerophila]SHF74348.1 hypothetical protein SAMN05444274_10888 [Mariniphaga anaerophila]